MRARCLILVLAVMLAFPPVSHGFGLLRYIYDGLANQFGLDRGPIPKILPKTPPPGHQPSHADTVREHPDTHRIHIQAEGF